MAHFSKLCHSTTIGTVETTTPKNLKEVKRDSEKREATASRTKLKTDEKAQVQGPIPIKTLLTEDMATLRDPMKEEKDQDTIAISKAQNPRISVIRQVMDVVAEAIGEKNPHSKGTVSSKVTGPPEIEKAALKGESRLKIVGLTLTEPTVVNPRRCLPMMG